MKKLLLILPLVLCMTVAQATVSFFGTALFNPTNDDGSIALAETLEMNWYSLTTDVSDAITAGDSSIFDTIASSYTAFATTSPGILGGGNVVYTANGTGAITLGAALGAGDQVFITLGGEHLYTSASWITPADGGSLTMAPQTTAALSVPEPSTYALLAGFAAFLFVAIRRRK